MAPNRSLSHRQTMRFFFVVTALVLISDVLGIDRITEFQRYDGWFNNLANPDWGSVGTRLHRDTPSNYRDGVYMLDGELPSAREISNLVFRGPAGIRNQRGITTMLAFFSQVVAYEIMQATQISCPLEMYKIPVPRCDRVFDPECQGQTEIPFPRTKYDKESGHGFNSPREQVNDRTSWIDASFLYGTQEPWVAALRSWKNGSLAEGQMPGYPPWNDPHIPLINPPPPQIHRLMNPERLYILGDSRVNENPGLLSFGLILHRWHNRNAIRLQALHPDWNDEELFQAARRWVIATFQKIVLYDFLPALLAEDQPLPSYRGYDPHLPPGISHAFAVAAFRFPHSIVPPALLLRKRGECQFRTEIGGFAALRLCQNWWNAQDIVAEYSVDEIVLGMASQVAEAEDAIVVEDLRDYIFGPMHFTRLDVVSSSIMRGRDNGLPSYNEMRRTFNLPPRTWETINAKMFERHPELVLELSRMYSGDIKRLDAYVGGMLETNGDGPGELFTAVIKDQFRRLRDADRFWFENRLNGLFTDDELNFIRRTTLHDIIRDTTSIAETDLQNNVFFWRTGDPCPQPFQVNATGLEPCVPFMRFDHFTGNEVPFIFTCIGLAAIPIVCAGIGCFLIQRRKRLGRSLALSVQKTNNEKKEKENAEEQGETGGKTGKHNRLRLNAIEWLNENNCRSVALVVDDSPSIRVEKPRGGLLRVVDLAPMTHLALRISEPRTSRTHGPFVLVKVPQQYDLVVRLESDAECARWLRALSTNLKMHNKQLMVSQAPNNHILDEANTAERRQQRLERFFREAYSKAFNAPQLSDGGETKKGEDSEQEQGQGLDTALTQAELAEALGMRENDLFVQRMFAAIARNQQETISFGGLEEKLRVVFEMCDREGTGSVQRDEFCLLIRSLNLSAGVRADPVVQQRAIDAVLVGAGIERDRDILTYKDFEAIFSQVDDTRRPVGVHLRGARLKINLDETASLNSFAVHAVNNNNINVSSSLLTVESSSRLSLCLAYLETYRQHIAVLFLFAAANLLVFFDRFWHYRYESEHRDLRRVMGAGIAVTRGAAAAISLCMGLILLTVSRNVLTLLRETPVASFVPLDAAIAFHKIVAVSAGFWAVVHTVGHCINFYHVATQSQEGLQCLFTEAVFSSNFLPSISYWFYGTLTGITGILLVVTMSVIYVFSAPAVIREAYHAFRLTHLLIVLIYALTILHGLPKLLDSPKFWCYVVGPITIFVLDRIIGMRQEYKRLQILDAVLLPSDIVYIQFKRPISFRYRSGQWIRVSCPAFNCTFNERHGFSIASAPQDSALEVYIKAVGPWTWKLRDAIAVAQAENSPYPTLHLNGPYGDGNQEWRQFDVAVFIGGGIGVTPYASTLTDLLLEKSSGRHHDVRCKKAYFVWICPTHKNFEWFIDILRRAEELDTENILDIHIFITQYFHKFDLRTTMLYICEKHFRGDHGGRSMFTGLKAVNHFGRPNFGAFFKYLQCRHSEVADIGVFSCGPSSINKQIRQSCTEANRCRDAPSFVHRFETF